ncbi:MAG: carbamoyltransferase C-terminal domain-containing protein [bacterium]|jgi:carbamoyltransferase|nr:carbamoyltransferase C-terminal domain-containing protein [bacterium]
MTPKTLNIVGISAYDLNPAACLMIDGKLVAFAEEERFNRIKQSENLFPIRSMKFCLDRAGLSLKDVDHLAVGWDYNLYRFRVPANYLVKYLKNLFNIKHRINNSQGLLPASDGIIDLFKKQPSYIIPRTIRILRTQWPTDPIPTMRFLNHHLCHACCTFFCCGEDQAAIMTYDGSGELHSLTLGVGEGKRIKFFTKITYTRSLGDFYSAFTEYLGFTPHRNEGKLMGLAAYGKEDPEIEGYIDNILLPSTNGDYRLNQTYILVGAHSYGRFYTDDLVSLLGPPRGHGEEITERHQNIAFSVQQRLEQAATVLARKTLKLAGSKTLCMAGGVALNCTTNMILREQAGLENIFIPPVPHDSGTALGAAMIIALEHGLDPRFHMDHPYYGPDFSNEAIAAIVNRLNLPFTRPKNMPDSVARLLADGKTVGWFSGRMEIGPRALGARSILAHPGLKDMKDRLNLKVKGREPWRPFAPSALQEYAGEWLQNIASAPFMTQAFRVSSDWRERIPAVVHVDGTTRPHLVNKNTAPRYWEMINSFHALTGIPLVLNTSFNLRGEPIICTPVEAIRDFYGSGLDALALEDFLLTKKTASSLT